jgi:uracil phosphoribosyltransferase
MTKLRDVRTGTAEFRQLLKEITFYLGYEATRELKVSPQVVKTPMNIAYEGVHLEEKVAIIPILRAGLGMLLL